MKYENDCNNIKNLIRFNNDNDKIEVNESLLRFYAKCIISKIFKSYHL